MTDSSASPNDFDIHTSTKNNYNDTQVARKIKRRDRKTISCTTCRKRKIKCDRAKPICGACKKNNVPTHLCVYDDTPWVSAVVKEQTLKNNIAELKETNEKLNALIKKRKAENEALTNGYEDYIRKISKKGNTILPIDEQNHTPYENIVERKVDSKEYDKFRDAKLNIRQLAIFKVSANKEATKTFGAFSWQAIGYKKDSFLKRIIENYEQHLYPFRAQYKDMIKPKESFSLDLLDWRQIYHTLNIQKRYTSLVIDSDKPNKNDIFGKKLQELAKALPPYRFVEKKFNYFFDMKYASAIDKFFVEEEIKEDFYRIFKKTKKGAIVLDVYTEGRSYYTELVRLAGIFLFIKFGINFSEDDEQSLDPDNMLPKYTIACLYIGRAYIEPSLITLMVMIFLETLRYLNPDDFGDELYTISGSIDRSHFTNAAFNIATSLGLANDYSRIPDSLKDTKSINETYLTEQTLHALWMNLVNLDWKQAILTGSPLILPTFMGYDKTCSDRKLNHIGMMRKMCERYSIFNERSDQPLDAILSLDSNPIFTRRDMENDLLELTTYFNDNVKSEVRFWDDFKIRTMETLPEKDQRVLQTLEVLDLTCSLNFFLFESYESRTNPINVQEDDGSEYSEQDLIHLRNLTDKYLNNSLFHACYILKIVEWTLEQVISNEAVNKSRLLQVISFPVIKRTLFKAVLICTSLIMRNSTLDEFGVVYKYDKSNLNYKIPEKTNVFNYTLQEFDELCFQYNVNNVQNLQFFNESFSQDLMHFWSKIYRYIKKIEFLKRDIKWFVSFREFFFGVYYLVLNKRKHLGNGKLGDPTQNYDLSDVFKLEEHLKFKNMYENNIDPEHDYNRYTLNYILN